MLQELRKKDVKLSPRAAVNFRQFLAVMILVLFAVSVAAVYWNLLPPRKDLYNELWGPAHLLVRGQSPYDTASLNPVLPAAWLPMSIGFFFPLGWLAEETALYAWFLFSLVELTGILYLLRRGNKSIPAFIAVSMLAFGFPSVIHHLILGQFSLTTAFCLVAGVPLILKGRHWLGAFFLALALSKIHLMTLPMLGLSLLYYREGGFRNMLAFWARVGAACLILTLPLFIAYPNWIPDAVRSMTSNAPWAFPTLQKFLVFNLGSLGMWLWAVSVIIVVLISLLIWKRLDPPAATYWNMGLALLISPYIGSWDFVVLLPLIVHTFLPASPGRKIFYLIAYVTAWALMARIQLLTESHNHFFWWVPIWHLAALALIADWRASPPHNDPRTRP